MENSFGIKVNFMSELEYLKKLHTELKMAESELNLVLESFEDFKVKYKEILSTNRQFRQKSEFLKNVVASIRNSLTNLEYYVDSETFEKFKEFRSES